MSNKSNKPLDAKPRAPDPKRYRIKTGDGVPKQHFISGRMHGPGDEVQLLPGVKPGKWLEEIGAKPAPKAEDKADGDKAGDDKKG